MLAIEAWGADRFKPVAALAQVIAASAKECHEIVMESRGPWLLSGETQPKSWLRFYRQPLRLEDAIWRILLPQNSQNEYGNSILSAALMRQELMAGLRQKIEQVLTKGITGREFERACRSLDLLYQRVHLPMIRRRLAMDDCIRYELDGWLFRQELIFFLSVAMPCWLEFHQTPWALFQEARRGDIQALEKLIRLDPEVDKEQTLQSKVFRLRLENPEQYRLLNEARIEGRNAKITFAQVKFMLGGLLMKWSKEIQHIVRGELLFTVLEANTNAEHRREVRIWIKTHRKQAERNGIKCLLKAPDIKSLFDAIAKDTGVGLVDPDFDGQPNTIYKRLDRNAKPWPTLQETDISRAA